MTAAASGVARFGAGALGFGLDEVGVPFLLLFAFLWALCGAYAWVSVPVAERGRLFAWYLPAAIGGVAVALATDAVSFYLCFALMSLASWGLITHDRTEESRRAGAVYLALTVLGEALLLGGMMLLAARAGSTELSALRAAAAVSPLALLMVVGAIMLKIGALPAAGVLPLAYSYTPAGPASALAGASVKVGALAMMRFLPFGSGMVEWQAALVVLGAATALGAAVLGVLTTSPRAALGYSSASQMGLVTIAAGVGMGSAEASTLAGSAIVAYSLHHGLAKSALVLGDDVVGRLSGRAQDVALAALALPALALVGVPLTSGFVAKYALKDAVHAMGGPLGHAIDALLPWMAIGTAAVMLRFFALMQRRTAGAADATRSAVGLWAILLFPVALACWLWPAEWARHAFQSAMKPASVWAALWPALVAGLAGTVVARAVHPGRLRQGVVPPGDVLIGVAGLVLKLGAAPRRRATRQRGSIVRLAATLAQGALAGETRLIAWSVAGVAFVALAVVMALLIAG